MPPAVVAAIIGGGAAVGSAAIASRGQSKAADKQAEAIEKGIALQREMYQQDRADMAPYRGLGGGAIGNLAYLSGINLPAEAKPADPAAPLTKDQTLASLGLPPTLGLPQGMMTNKVNAKTDEITRRFNDARAASGGQTVRISRQGRTIEVPSTLLPKALSDGWSQVQ